MRDKNRQLPFLFWELSVSEQAKLMQYQWDNYGEKLDLPPEPKEPGSTWDSISLESIEKIDKLMRRKPRHKGKE